MSNARNRALCDEAAGWVARMDGAAWTPADETALQNWLSIDDTHRGALLQAQAAWMSLDHDVFVVSPPVHDDWTRPTMPRRDVLLAGAGAIAASLAGGLVFLRSGTTYSTGLGEIRKIPLADGSSATINSGSRLEVILAARRRDVRIASGEAWFQVAKDARRPFTVEAGAVVVQAVGTAFAVRRLASGAVILVTEGVVEVWAGQSRNRTRMTAGQRAYVGDDAIIEVARDEPSDVDRALAWRSGSIDLRGQSLADAIREFNRYNRRKLVLDDGTLVLERFDGIFRTDDPEGFAMAVRASLDAAIDLTDPAIIRIGRPGKKVSPSRKEDEGRGL